MTDEQIIEALRATTAPEAMQQMMVANARKVVGLRAATAIEEMLTPEQQSVYEQFQGEGNDQAIWDWLRSEVVGVDVSEVYEATLKTYLEELESQLI